MKKHQAYQGHQIEGAGPLGLVLLTYEALHKSLGQAHRAIEARDLAKEAEYTGRAMEAIIELLSSLNMEEGGEIAANLARLYMYMMNRLTEGLCSGSTRHIDEVMRLAQELREGWMGLKTRLEQSESRPAQAQPARIKEAA